MNLDVFRTAAEAGARHTPVWMATVIAVDGSTPVEPGMKMAVKADGSAVGTIGGGEIERRVIERIHSEKPTALQRWRYDLGLNVSDAEKTGMVCGGFQEILIEPLFVGTPLFIIGGGHCGVALSTIASRTGFTVTVLDDREEWASTDKHPGALQVVRTSFLDIVPHIAFSPETFIVIMTHGHKHDEAALRQVVRKEYRYLGMLGSERKAADVLARLTSDGFTREELARIHTPAGFDIGSHTPEEIAVSLLAQMVAVKNGKPAENGVR